MSGGTYNVSRKVWDHPVFKDEKYTEREAFMWLVGAACWRPHAIRSGSSVLELQRGQLSHSIRFLAEKWDWKRSTVQRFIERLKKWDMVRAESGTGQNVITICNYDKYQNKPKDNGTDVGQQRDASGTAAGQQRDKEEYLTNKINKENTKKDFDVLWGSYPKKTAKKPALASYIKARKKVGAATISVPLIKYTQMMNGTEMKFYPNLASWLNQERWNDELQSKGANKWAKL